MGLWHNSAFVLNFMVLIEAQEWFYLNFWSTVDGISSCDMIFEQLVIIHTLTFWRWNYFFKF